MGALPWGRFRRCVSLGIFCLSISLDLAWKFELDHFRAVSFSLGFSLGQFRFLGTLRLGIVVVDRSLRICLINPAWDSPFGTTSFRACPFWELLLGIFRLGTVSRELELGWDLLTCSLESFLLEAFAFGYAA